GCANWRRAASRGDRAAARRTFDERAGHINSRPRRRAAAAPVLDPILADGVAAGRLRDAGRDLLVQAGRRRPLPNPLRPDRTSGAGDDPATAAGPARPWRA